MPRCDVCGNDYDKAFTVTLAGGGTRTFDTVECAAHVLAPACGRCGCRVLGHGAETEGVVYCSAHCARAAGHPGMTDRA